MAEDKVKDKAKEKPIEEKPVLLKKSVLLEKNCFNKRNNYELRTAIVEVPELNDMMDLKEGEVASIKVKQMDLKAFLSSREEITNQVNNLIEGILEATKESSESVKDEILSAWKKAPPDVKYRISMVHQCIVEPELNESDVIWLSQVFPLVLMRLSNRIVQLTELGGDLKKNSKG